jgi:predicted nucleotidyltransferase
MKPSEVLEKNRQAIRDATKRFNAANPRVFGSVARGEDRADSDLDILVDALPGTTLFNLGGLLEELQDILGVKVDLVTPGGLPDKIKARVLSLPLRLAYSLRCRRRCNEAIGSAGEEQAGDPRRNEAFQRGEPARLRLRGARRRPRR